MGRINSLFNAYFIDKSFTLHQANVRAFISIGEFILSDETGGELRNLSEISEQVSRNSSLFMPFFIAFNVIIKVVEGFRHMSMNNQIYK